MLLDRLPMSSAYMEARLGDPEMAELILATGEGDGPPPRPVLAEWTPDVAMLAHLVDRLGEMIAVTIQVNGGKAPQITPMPRPVTAVEVARARKEAQRHYDLVDEVRAAQERWLASREADATG